jgi:signal transduction histidine kinase
MGNEPANTAQPGHPRVLCILQQTGIRLQVRAVLERDGFVVSEADTGLAGVAAAERSSPDVVLVDFHLPDIEGTAVATHLRHARANLPIVALAEPGHEHKIALSAGCNGVVDAPTNLETLGKVLREFIAGKREKLKSVEEARLLKEYSAALVDTLESKISALTQMNQRLIAVDRFKTEFVQSITHELASPLTPIAGYLKILQSERLGPLNEKQTKVIESMIQSAERLSRVIDSLGDFASLDTGSYKVVGSVADPAAILADVLNQKHALARTKRISVRARGLAPGELMVRMDAKRVQQAMGHLLENAIKYSPAGSDVLVDLHATASGGIRFSVYDQGAGVPKSEQERIFEPFHHVERAGAGEAGGAGLGLAVTQKIVQSHGGTIGLESPPKMQPEQGRQFTGSHFYFEIHALNEHGQFPSRP